MEGDGDNSKKQAIYTGKEITSSGMMVLHSPRNSQDDMIQDGDEGGGLGEYLTSWAAQEEAGNFTNNPISDMNKPSNENANMTFNHGHDPYVPIANVTRIMRRILPSYAKIADGAKETVRECVSEYISFITGVANERCQQEHRKTITPEDIIYAMDKLGFDDYIEPLTLYLNRYREQAARVGPYARHRFLSRPPAVAPQSQITMLAHSVSAMPPNYAQNYANLSAMNSYLGHPFGGNGEPSSSSSGVGLAKDPYNHSTPGSNPYGHSK